MTADKLDSEELKSRFKVKHYGKSKLKDGWGKFHEVDSYYVVYREPNQHRTRRVYATSELACWRIIDLAIFFLRVKNGEDVTFPENHKVLERKAFHLIHGDADYNLAEFKNYRH